MMEMSKKPMKFCTDFFVVDFFSAGILIKVFRILIPAVLTMITYGIKILNYNYSVILICLIIIELMSL